MAIGFFFTIALDVDTVPRLAKGVIANGTRLQQRWDVANMLFKYSYFPFFGA